MKVGEKLPSNIVDIMQQVISKKTLEKIEFKAENKIYSLAFIPLPEQEIVNIFGLDISEQKELNRKEDNIENCRQGDMESKIRMLESIIGSSHDAIITKSFDGTILSWNKGAEMIYGYSAKEVLGKPISILEPPFLLDETKELTEIVGHEEIINYYETLRLRKDGRIINVSLTLSPIFDAVENVIGVLVIARDITRSKQLEEKLQRSEEIYRIASEQTGLLVYDYDLRTDICRWSGAIEEVTGYSPEEFQMLGKYVWATNIQRLNDNLSVNHFNAFVTKNRYIEELKLRRKDGTYIYVENKGVCLKDTLGRTYEIIGVIKDVTNWKETVEKAKESEEKYRNIVETANEGIVIIDSNNVVTYSNQKMAEMLGYTVEEGIGKSTWDFIYEKDRPMVESYLKRRASGMNDSYELRLKSKDGLILWTYLNAKPLFNNKGKFTGVLGMFTDITKRKEADEALAHINIARQKEIHHRIKNNLQVISSLLDLQADKFKNKVFIKKSEVLEAFKESQQRVISMALIHEEIQKAGNTELLNFSEYIEKLADYLFSTYKVGNALIKFSKDIESNIFFDMDISIPLGIISNELISNSLKYAFPDRDTGEIRIKIKREKNEKHIVEDCNCTSYFLSISDNGVGIPEDFDTEDLDSLGLQLVAILVDQLDGELELKRENSTEFKIRFAVTEETN